MRTETRHYRKKTIFENRCSCPTNHIDQKAQVRDLFENKVVANPFETRQTCFGLIQNCWSDAKRRFFIEQTINERHLTARCEVIVIMNMFKMRRRFDYATRKYLYAYRVRSPCKQWFSLPRSRSWQTAYLPLSSRLQRAWNGNLT